MERSSHHRRLTKSVEELMFGKQATRKNRFDIDRFVTALLDAVEDEVARRVAPPPKEVDE